MPKCLESLVQRVGQAFRHSPTAPAMTVTLQFKQDHVLVQGRDKSKDPWKVFYNSNAVFDCPNPELIQRRMTGQDHHLETTLYLTGDGLVCSQNQDQWWLTILHPNEHFKVALCFDAGRMYPAINSTITVGGSDMVAIRHGVMGYISEECYYVRAVCDPESKTITIRYG